LLRELSGIPPEQRQARFLTVASMADSSGRVQAVEGPLDGLITEAPAGTSGFGYDPVFFVPEIGKTLAQLTLDEKNRISHRARAFAKVKGLLQTTDNTPQGVGA
jgi:XTP/dITP diphosphohydrolase